MTSKTSDKTCRPFSPPDGPDFNQIECRLAALLGELAPLLAQLSSSAVCATKDGEDAFWFAYHAVNSQAKLKSLAAECRLLSLVVATASGATNVSFDDLVV